MKSDIQHYWLRGKVGEEIAKQDYKDHGFKIISTQKGSDFIASKRIGGTLYQEYVEVKTGNSRLTKVQKRKMKEIKKVGICYTVYRISKTFLDHQIATRGYRID